MDNTSKKAFKKSFMGGFKKEDVASYIADLAAEHSRELESVREELKVANSKIEDLSSENQALSNEKKDLIKKVDDLSVKVTEGDDAKAELIALKEEYEALNAEKEKLEAEIASLKNEISAKDVKISQYEAKEIELSRSKEQIANLELDARNRSKQLEDDAKARIANELAAHKAYIESENEKLSQYRAKTIAEVEAIVAEVADTYGDTKKAVYEFKTGFKGVVAELARGIDTISDASLGIENAFNALKTECDNMREGK